MLEYLKELYTTLQRVSVRGTDDVVIMSDVLRSLQRLIGTMSAPRTPERRVETETVEMPVDPRLQEGGGTHADDE